MTTPVQITPRNAVRNSLWRRIHEDQRGAVSLETILIVAAIALPILIFILKFGWPRIRDYFNNGLNSLETESNNVTNGGGTGGTGR